jgi:hypothetical protein
MTASKETATIAVLNNKLDSMGSQLNKLEGRFDTFQANFIRQDVYNIKHEELVRQVAHNTNEIYRLQKGRWMMPMATLVLGGVLTFLINFALTH